MKITNNNPSINLDAYIKNKPVEPDKKNGAETAINSDKVKTDQVVLSSMAKEIRDLKKLVDSAPDIHEEKINEIKQKIERGDYEIDSDKIAFKLIKESLLNNDL